MDSVAGDFSGFLWSMELRLGSLKCNNQPSGMDFIPLDIEKDVVYVYNE